VNEVPCGYPCHVCSELRRKGLRFSMTAPVLRGGRRCPGCRGAPYEHHHHAIIEEESRKGETQLHDDEKSEFKRWKELKKLGMA